MGLCRPGRICGNQQQRLDLRSGKPLYNGHLLGSEAFPYSLRSIGLAGIRYVDSEVK